MKSGRHANIPVFVPHLACPNNCVFCNQKRISGTTEVMGNVYSFLSQAAKKLDVRFSTADIAFFGGSFTGIEESLMRKYLSAAKKVMEENSRITGIRLSTRPDYINRGILEILKEYGVTTVELGAQSFCDDVLNLSRRGHNSADIKNASSLVKQYGFELVLQLMTGLPGDSYEKSIFSANEASRLNPDSVRIYPCVVLKDTDLFDMTSSGEYTPISVEESVVRAADMMEIFVNKGIRVLRVGLHSSDLVNTDSVVGGGFHPALGEMVISRLYLKEAEQQLAVSRIESHLVFLEVHNGCISKMNGQNRENISFLEKKYGVKFRTVEVEMLPESLRYVNVRFV